MVTSFARQIEPVSHFYIGKAVNCVGVVPDDSPVGGDEVTTMWRDSVVWSPKLENNLAVSHYYPLIPRDPPLPHDPPLTGGTNHALNKKKLGNQSKHSATMFFSESFMNHLHGSER